MKYSTLYIKNIDKSDEGNYTCQVSDEDNKSQNTIIISPILGE